MLAVYSGELLDSQTGTFNFQTSGADSTRPLRAVDLEGRAECRHGYDLSGIGSDDGEGVGGGGGIREGEGCGEYHGHSDTDMLLNNDNRVPNMKRKQQQQQHQQQHEEDSNCEKDSIASPLPLEEVDLERRRRVEELPSPSSNSRPGNSWPGNGSRLLRKLTVAAAVEGVGEGKRRQQSYQRLRRHGNSATDLDYGGHDDDEEEKEGGRGVAGWSSTSPGVDRRQGGDFPPPESSSPTACDGYLPPLDRAHRTDRQLLLPQQQHTTAVPPSQGLHCPRRTGQLPPLLRKLTLGKCLKETTVTGREGQAKEESKGRRRMFSLGSGVARTTSSREALCDSQEEEEEEEVFVWDSDMSCDINGPSCNIRHQSCDIHYKSCDIHYKSCDQQEDHDCTKRQSSALMGLPN